jgi:uncharacterized protein (TIGR02145 family)
MKNKIIIITAFVIITANAMGQLLKDTVVDIDKNVYHTVKIGTQIWMVENLKTTKYNNGDFLENGYDQPHFMNYIVGAYLDYIDLNNSKIYGKLYNWLAVHDSKQHRNISPRGWHIPNDNEWDTLITYLGGDQVAGGKLKEEGTSHWKSSNTSVNNYNGFTALPAGILNDIGFAEIGESSYWWSSDEYVSGVYKYGPPDQYRGNAWENEVITQGLARYVRIFYSKSNAIHHSKGWPENNGLSIRCLKDSF